MILGYGIIAVPTGIVSAEIAKQGNEKEKDNSDSSCTDCGAKNQPKNANYCYNCGNHLLND